MKLYQSIKQVWAEEMTLGEFLKVKDSFPKSSNGDESDHLAAGYHVCYGKDTDDEYHSWCPKHIFEGGNMLIEVDPAKPLNENGAV